MATPPLASPDSQVSDLDIAKIARKINNWKELSPFLGLAPQDETVIERSCSGYLEQKSAALHKWRDMKGKLATYRALIAAAKGADNENLADYVQTLTTGQTATGNVQPRVQQDGRAASSETELTADDDMMDVSTYLSPLSKEEIKTLGRLLGLGQSTVTDQYDGPKGKYLDSILTAWFKKQDKVIEKGGPKWSVLVKFLRHGQLRQNGIATNIEVERLS